MMLGVFAEVSLTGILLTSMMMGGVGVVANVSLTGLLLKCLILGISDLFY